jgi:hypothetical protein
MPLAAVAAAPITLIFGPRLAYNALFLLAVPLNAWSTFIVCRHLTRNHWASLLGGYIFGFSAYMLSHIAYGHLALVLVFPIPLAIYLVLLRFEDQIRRSAFLLWFSLLMIAEFLLWPESFATFTMFGGVALVTAVAFAGWSLRLSSLLADIATCYGITLLSVSPYLYYFFGHGIHTGPIFSPEEFSADFLGFLVPTRLNELGRVGALERLSSRFMGGWLAENGSCLSLPLIVLVAVYARQTRKELLTRTLIVSLLIVCVCALGPVLHVAGVEMPAALPWILFRRAPILKNALPARFVMYAFLIVAIVASLWFAVAQLGALSKVGIALIVAGFNLPNLSAAMWSSPTDTPIFFRDGAYKQYLHPEETIITLPYGYSGNAMLWQAQAGMYFKMAEGYGAARPQEFQVWPIVEAFLQRWFVPGAEQQLRAFLDAYRISAIVVTDAAFPTWRGLLSRLNVTPQKVADVRVYRLSDLSVRDRLPAMDQMSSRFNLARFGALVAAVQRYVEAGRNPAELSVLGVEKLGLLPDRDLIGPQPAVALGTGALGVITDPHSAYGIYLGRGKASRIAIGVFAWNPVELIRRLRKVTGVIYFPYPTRASGEDRVSLERAKAQGWLLAEFTREELDAASGVLEVANPSNAREDAQVVGSPGAQGTEAGEWLNELQCESECGRAVSVSLEDCCDAPRATAAARRIP